MLIDSIKILVKFENTVVFLDLRKWGKQETFLCRIIVFLLAIQESLQMDKENMREIKRCYNSARV